MRDSTIEIEIPANADIYMSMKNLWHPPEGKCHVLHRHCGMQAPGTV